MKRVIKRAAILLLLLGLTIGVTASVKPKQAQADSGWTWAVTTDGNSDIWMTASFYGSAKFAYCLGAGGCIQSMQFVPQSRELLCPGSVLCPTSRLDRVIQWTFFGQDLHDPQDNISDDRFNINQAGASGRFDETSQFDEDDEIFAPILSVDVHDNMVDIYAVPQEFFFQVHSVPDENNHIHQAGNLACFTRYEMLDYGILKVRRIVRVCEASNRSYDAQDPNYHDPNVPYHVTLTAWTPYRRSSESFTAVTEALNQTTGLPTGTQYVTPNIPETPPRAVTGTSGFAVVYQYGHADDMPAVATVFGTANTLVVGNGGSNPQYVFQRGECQSPYQGIGGITITVRVGVVNCPPGSIIDHSIYIVANPACKVAMKNHVNSCLSQVPAPIIYGPNADLSGNQELADIVSELDDNSDVAVDPEDSRRTPHLGELID